MVDNVLRNHRIELLHDNSLKSISLYQCQSCAFCVHNGHIAWQTFTYYILAEVEGMLGRTKL